MARPGDSGTGSFLTQSIQSQSIYAKEERCKHFEYVTEAQIHLAQSQNLSYLCTLVPYK